MVSQICPDDTRGLEGRLPLLGLAPVAGTHQDVGVGRVILPQKAFSGAGCERGSEAGRGGRIRGKAYLPRWPAERGRC